MRPTSDPHLPDSMAKPRWWLHILLFVLTIFSTSYVGVYLVDLGVDPNTAPDAMPGFFELLQRPGAIAGALSYALSVLGILLCHELGHYLPARSYNVGVTPPYFLPGFPPFGTFGAFIRMQMDRISVSKLFHIGAGGPFAGFAVALPVLIIGLLLSEVKPVPEALEGASLGDSLLMLGLIRLLFGEIAQGHDVFLHPMAYAGWVGMFVTSFNLVPLGQLDGGHIAYTLFGERFNRAAWFLFAGLIAMGLFVFAGWFVLAGFVLFMRPTHPPVVHNSETLRGVERVWGYLALVVFALTFVPKPFAQAPSLIGLVFGE